MGLILGITGTPGTGKKTLAPKVAKALGMPVFSINNLLSPLERSSAAKGVDPLTLRRRLMRRNPGRCVVFGHLVPDVLQKRDIERVVVLRCDPSVLRRRLSLRGYSSAKVAGNVEAELIGVVSASCYGRFGPKKVVEFDATRASIAESARKVERLLTSRTPRKAPLDWVPAYSSAEKLRSLLSVARTESAFT